MGIKKKSIGDRWGFVNECGVNICPIKYDWVYDFKDNTALVKLNDKYSMINTDGVEVTGWHNKDEILEIRPTTKQIGFQKREVL